jgi:hypothetical protein
MSNNTAVVVPGTVDAGKYEAQISGFVTACLSKKKALTGIHGSLWGACIAAFGTLTALEYKVVRSETSARLKASEFADASVDTMFSAMAKFLAHGVTGSAIPATWNAAKEARAKIVETERKNGTGDKRGRQAVRTQATGVAVNPETGDVTDTKTGAPTGENVETPAGGNVEAAGDPALALADPIQAMLDTLRRKIAALLLHGYELEQIEDELVSTLARLEPEETEQSNDDAPIVGETGEGDAIGDDELPEAAQVELHDQREAIAA